MKTLVATANMKHSQRPQLVPADIFVPKRFMLLLSVVKTGIRAASAATPIGMKGNFFVCGKKVITTATIDAIRVSMPQLSTPSWNPFTDFELLTP